MITDKSLPHAIFLDIDGTLMEVGATNALDMGEIPKRNIHAMREAQRRGHKMFINTGRGFACLPQAAINAGFDGFITGLGSLIEIDGKVVYNCPIPDAMVEKAIDYCASHGLPVRMQGKTCRVCYDPVGIYGDYWQHFGSYAEFKQLSGDSAVSKITFDKLSDQQDVDFLDRNFNLYMHGKSAGEATSKGCNKALAMQFALDIMGIPKERSIAMGDSVNDIEMLLGSGTSVAMDNADDEVKRLSDYITSSCAEGGVGKAIENLLLK